VAYPYNPSNAEGIGKRITVSVQPQAKGKTLSKKNLNQKGLIVWLK
jgi:hypothetical protein